MMRENLLAAHMSLNTTIGRSNQVALSQVVQIVQNISSPAVPPVSAPGTSDPTILLQLERIITMMLERPLPPPQARALASSSRPSSKHTNEPQHDVQVHGSNDSNTPAMSNRPPNHPKARQTLIKIESTLDVKCNNPCTCQCHIRTSVKSPLWARFLIGSFFYQATGRVFIGSGSCDSRCCQKTTSSQVRLTYYAPSWLGWKPLVMSATNNSLPGLNSTISLRVPDFVPWDNPLWDLIYEGDVTGLQRYMSKYRVNPNTVEEFGRSLLFAAVGYCQHEISTFLVQEGADPLHQDVNGMACKSLSQTLKFLTRPFGPSIPGSKHFFPYRILLTNTSCQNPTISYSDSMKLIWIFISISIHPIGKT
ncbi:hypothetical protein DM02DRAFT_339422 [Periconia macrospinosa]|uniref:Ankyrin n=1 Tax=Periconia macrospinosa TaxID=97972 RepID=A0A2V1DTQ6_9PLEO|nr:hypothetical protein DM02DRAFT_339422 [Periconia macrospinosa]